jgi:hypothetical protein
MKRVQGVCWTASKALCLLIWEESDVPPVR